MAQSLPVSIPNSCSICFEAFQTLDPHTGAEEPVMLYCGHIVGSGCIEAWFQNAPASCPMCRRTQLHSCGHICPPRSLVSSLDEPGATKLPPTPADYVLPEQCIDCYLKPWFHLIESDEALLAEKNKLLLAVGTEILTMMGRFRYKDLEGNWQEVLKSLTHMASGPPTSDFTLPNGTCLRNTTEIDRDIVMARYLLDRGHISPPEMHNWQGYLARLVDKRRAEWGRRKRVCEDKWRMKVLVEAMRGGAVDGEPVDMWMLERAWFNEFVVRRSGQVFKIRDMMSEYYDIMPKAKEPMVKEIRTVRW